ENSLPSVRARKQGVVVGDGADAVAVPLAQFNAVNAPACAIDVLDNDGGGEVMLRNLGQVGRQHAGLLAFDLAFQDGDFANGVFGKQGGEASDLHGATATGTTE